MLETYLRIFSSVTLASDCTVNMHKTGKINIFVVKKKVISAMMSNFDRITKFVTK